MAVTLESRIAALESKIQELDTLLNLTLRLLAVEKPLSALLERYGATQAEERAVQALLDEVATRAGKGGKHAPSFASFAQELFDRFPAVRGDREFVAVLLDTLKLDRAVYQKLHAYARSQGWPQWS